MGTAVQARRSQWATLKYVEKVQGCRRTMAPVWDHSNSTPLPGYVGNYKRGRYQRPCQGLENKTVSYQRGNSKISGEAKTDLSQFSATLTSPHLVISAENPVLSTDAHSTPTEE